MLPLSGALSQERKRHLISIVIEEGSSGLPGQLLKDISMRFMWQKALSKANRYIQVEHSDIITLIKKSVSSPQICHFFPSLCGEA